MSVHFFVEILLSLISMSSGHRINHLVAKRIHVYGEVEANSFRNL